LEQTFDWGIAGTHLKAGAKTSFLIRSLDVSSPAMDDNSTDYCQTFTNP
jgi:hypothetical protein